MAVRSRHRRNTPLSRREKWVAAALVPAIMAPPWFLGGMRWWQQLIFLALAIPPFILCFIRFRGDQNQENLERESPLSRLLRFPPFWLTLLFLVYLSIGALNYSWEYVLLEGGARWRMERLPSDQYIHWLPNGVKAPYMMMDAWRVVIIYTAGLLLVCSVWLGIERRRTLWFLVGVIGFNAFMVALLTILQDLSGTKLIYWTFNSANPNFAGPFQYRNHGGAYMYIGLGCCFGCAFYYWNRGGSFGRKSNPAPLFLFFAFIIASGILFASSRGGILFGGLIIVAATILFLGTSLLKGKQGLVALGGVALALIVGILFARPYLQRAIPELEKRLAQTEKQLEAGREDSSVIDQRLLLSRATIEMWESNPWFGWGAGSFRWIFPKYQYEYPRLRYAWWSVVANQRNPERFKLKSVTFYNAHNDWAQFIAEYGFAGASLLVLVIGYWVYKIIISFCAWSLASWILLIDCGVVILHGLIDFLFYNPPILFAFIFVLAVAGTSTQLEYSKDRSVD